MQITTLASGSTGNCALIREGETRILIDAGISCKRIKEGLRQEGLEPQDLDGVLITHEHSDHVSGLRVLEKHYQLPVFATLPVIHALEAMGADCIIPFHEIETGTVFSVNDVLVRAFHVPHDAADCVGYRFTGEHVLGYATDTGCITEEIIEGLSGADIALIEANHDIQMLRTGGYPYYLKKRILSGHGHLCNEDCARALIALHDRGVRNVILGHLSQENNSPELAQVTIDSALKAAGISDMNIMVANRDHPLGMFSIS